MYRLTGRLEQGELAELFRGEHLETGESVVIKLFHERTTDIAYAKVIGSIAHSLSALGGQRVAQVRDVGLVNGRLAIVRKDVGLLTLGVVLQRLNTREVVLPSALAIVLVLELVEVLAAAHAVGVVHGALTPGNVLVSDEGLPWVAEFGALEALQASAALRASFAGRGRTSYRAPELKTSATEATAASDLFATAAIAYELLTLREASTGAAVVSTRMARVPPPSRLVRRLNSRIDPVIMRALEANPARRHKSLLEFGEGLREFLSSQGGLPPREDLKKFVKELFPNEVVAGVLAPPPFEAAFALEALGDVGPIARESQQVLPRAPFSGGEVDEATPTSDGLPVFSAEQLEVAQHEAKTQPELPQQPATGAAPAKVESWSAPAGEAPLVFKDEVSNPEAVKRRVRALEAFDVSDQKNVGAMPMAPVEEAKRTVMTFAVDFQRDQDPELVDYERRKARAASQLRTVRALSRIILALTVTGLSIAWYRSTPDPKGAFLSYLPAPIAREFSPKNAPLMPAKPGPRIVLPDFDEQQLHRDAGQVAEVRPKPAQPAPSAPKADCFAQPRGKAGVLSVVGQNLQVEIDGVPVCGSLAKISVPVGAHVVRVIDLTTHKDSTSSANFEAGRLVKISASTNRTR